MKLAGPRNFFCLPVFYDRSHSFVDRSTQTAFGCAARIIKGITARRVFDYLKENDYTSSLEKLRHEVRNRNHRNSLWQTEKNVLPIFSEGMFMQKVNYVHNNPVRAGFVERAIDYRWSSARIWRGCAGEDEPLLVDIDRINWRQSR